MTDTIVVLGKTSIRKSEYPQLFDIGRAIALRGKTLRTTRTAGAARAIVEGYESQFHTALMTPRTEYMQQGEIPDHSSVMLFTDKKMETLLNEHLPNWRLRGWIAFLNPIGTTTAIEHIKAVLEILGTPLSEVTPSDGGSVQD